MRTITQRKLRLVSLPFVVAKLQGAVCELLPFAPVITRDQVALLAHDNILRDEPLTFTQLGIAPVSIEAMLPTYLTRFIKS
jgi:NADH dehydrogenase